MKISGSIILAASLLAFTALAASAAPAPDVAPAPAQPAAETPPADVFGASVLSQPDCAGTGRAKAVSGDPLYCGSCTPFACKFLEEGEQCGTGPAKFCQAIPGELCSIDGSARCECV